MESTDHSLLELVAALRAEVAAHREDMQHLARRLLAREDRDDLAIVLPGVHALLRDSTWTA